MSAEGELGIDARAAVGVHDDDRPLTAFGVPVERLGAGSVDACRPDGLVGRSGGAVGASLAFGGERQGVDVEVGDFVVVDAGQVALDVVAAGDADEERLAAFAADAQLRATVEDPVEVAVDVEVVGCEGVGDGLDAVVVGDDVAGRVGVGVVDPDGACQEPGRESRRRGFRR